MRAIILAAGVGSRLFGDSRTQPPKCLIEFDGETLLSRHIRLLVDLGITDLTLVVGYRKDLVMAEALRVAPERFVKFVENPMYRGGSVISMWFGRDVYRSGHDVLFMDADVLYAPEVLKRLLDSKESSAFIFDAHLDEGDDPVRICMRGGHVADFGKRIEGRFDTMGEWPGFMKISAQTGPVLAAALENQIEGGNLMGTYEEAIRAVLIGEPVGTIGIVDISDLPWVEIDFPEDLERARSEILSAIKQ